MRELLFIIMYCLYVDRDSSVGIATRYGLDGPGIESRWGARFSAPVQTDPGVHPPYYTMGTGSFPGVKRPGRGIDHPPSSSAEVKERVELYLYSPSGPSWLFIGWTSPLSLPLCIVYRFYKHQHCLMVDLQVLMLRFRKNLLPTSSGSKELCSLTLKLFQ
jgi:hypothetical protein